MAFCGNCGTKVEDGKKFCPECGAVMETQAPQQPQQQAPQQPQSQVQYQQPMQAQPQMQYQQPPQQPQPDAAKAKGAADLTAQFAPADIEANKIMAVLAYIFFLIPLLAAKESPYARFHTNQGLLVFIGGVLSGVLSLVCIGTILAIIVAVLGIMGIVNAWTGKAKELPIIGKIRIIK